MERKVWSISGLALELGIDRRTMAKTVEDLQPVRQDNRAKYYYLADAARALFAKGAGTFEGERTRLTRAQADKTELEVRHLRGELIRAEDVISIWADAVASVRANLISLPTKLATQAIAATSLKDVEDFARGEIYAALDELAHGDIGRRDRTAAEGAEVVHATAAPARKRVGRPRKAAVARG